MENRVECVVNILEVQRDKFFAQGLWWETEGWHTRGWPTGKVEVVVGRNGRLTVPRGSIGVAPTGRQGERTLHVTILAVDTSLTRLNNLALSSSVAGKVGSAHPQDTTQKEHFTGKQRMLLEVA